MFAIRDEIRGMKTLIFCHIEKTAGVTLRSILLRKFPGDSNYNFSTAINPQRINEFKRLSDKRKTEIKYLHTNMFPFGIHRHLPQSAEYITMVRHPVDRVISEYFFIIRTPSHPAYNAVKDLCFYDYVTKGVLASQVQNTQTRIIAGVGGAFKLSSYEKHLTKRTLAIAMKNIQEHYLLVGLVERFDETMILLKRALGWRMWDIFYKKQNVGNNHPPENEIATCTINIIKRYNRLDLELYEYAKQLFENRISEQDSSFERELWMFRFCNKIYWLFYPIRRSKVGILIFAAANLSLAVVTGKIHLSEAYRRIKAASGK